MPFLRIHVKRRRLSAALLCCSMIPMLTRFLLTLCLTAFPIALRSAPVSGEAVYKQHCASCHDSGNTRAPSRDDLKNLPVTRIVRALEFGLMSNVGVPLRAEERDAVAAYLGSPVATQRIPEKAYCADRSIKFTPQIGPQWNGWSPSPGNTRYQSASAAGLTVDQVRRLKLKWAYGFDGDLVAFAQPAVLGR